MKVALGIRGHIRDSLTDSKLREYVYKLCSTRGVDIDIYCHTWKEHEAKSSYRELDRSYTLKVNKDIIFHYFSCGKYNVANRIQNINVQDDSKMQLNGMLEGVVCDSKIPRIAWKRMWAGQLQLITDILKSGTNYNKVVNMRYDMFTTPICNTSEGVLRRVFQGQYELNFKYPIYNKRSIGVDNFYVGSLSAMHDLILDFHENLDEIAARYPKIQIHEQLVYARAKEKGYTN